MDGWMDLKNSNANVLETEQGKSRRPPEGVPRGPGFRTGDRRAGFRVARGVQDRELATRVRDWKPATGVQDLMLVTRAQA